jgi:hypothetical protein
MLDICAKAEGEEIIKHYYNKIKDKNEQPMV